MRYFILLCCVLAGCDTTCPGPNDVLNGVSWDVFSNVVTYEFQATNTPPPGVTPVNGRTTWQFAWTDPGATSLQVTIDDQVFAGTGQWDTVECGTFVANFSGTFVSSDGTTHDFSSGGLFRVYDGQLLGDMQWVEGWSTGTAVGGMNVSVSNVRGVAIGG